MLVLVGFINILDPVNGIFVMLDFQYGVYYSFLDPIWIKNSLLSKLVVSKTRVHSVKRYTILKILTDTPQ